MQAARVRAGPDLGPVPNTLPDRVEYSLPSTKAGGIRTCILLSEVYSGTRLRFSYPNTVRIRYSVPDLAG